MTTLSLESILLHYTDALQRLAEFPYPAGSRHPSIRKAIALFGVQVLL